MSRSTNPLISASVHAKEAEKITVNIKESELTEFVELILNKIDYKNYLADVNYNDLMKDISGVIKGQPPQVVIPLMQVETTKFSKRPELSSKLMKDVDKVLASDEFRNELDRLLVKYVSKVTGFEPEPPEEEHEVVDMEVSNGSSPEPELRTRAPPPPPPPMVLTMPPPFPPLPPPTLPLEIPLPRTFDVQLSHFAPQARASIVSAGPPPTTAPYFYGMR